MFNLHVNKDYIASSVATTGTPHSYAHSHSRPASTSYQRYFKEHTYHHLSEHTYLCTKTSKMSGITFTFDMQTTHVTDTQMQIIADIADANIQANIQDQNLAVSLYENNNMIRTTLEQHEDTRMGNQWLLSELCEAENGIYQMWDPRAPIPYVSMDDASIDPEALLSFPLWNAAYHASQMWGFPFGWERSAVVAQKPALSDTFVGGFGKLGVRSFQPGVPTSVAAKPMEKTDMKPASQKNNTTPASQSATHVAKAQIGLRGAPSLNLPFPSVPANMTMVEILVFFPQWIASRDVISRLLSNGGAQRVAATIMIAHRSVMADENNVTNMILKKFYRSMRVVHGKDWIPVDFVPAEDHDEDSLDVSGFRTRFQLEGTKTPSNPDSLMNFRDLANGVANIPVGSDALDLTRFVQHAVDNPDQNWMFPDDWATLAQRLGTDTVTDAHMDREVFLRYGGGAIRHKHRRDSEGTEEDLSEDNTDIAQHSKKPARHATNKSPSTKSIVPKKRALYEEDSDIDSDVSEFKGSRRANAMGKKHARNNGARQSGRKRAVRFENLDDDTLYGKDEEPSDVRTDAESDNKDGRPAKKVRT